MLPAEFIGTRGRLLTQLVEAFPSGPEVEPLASSSAGQEFQPAARQELRQLSAQTWILLVVGCMCAVLVVVLIIQWATELVAWRRRCRQQEQDEACRHHVQTYAVDVESPTKPSKPDGMEAESSAKDHAADEEAPAPPAPAPSDAAQQSQPSAPVQKAVAPSSSDPSAPPLALQPLQLPKSALKRAPSLRSVSSGSQHGLPLGITPSSPLSLSGRRRVVLARTNSSPRCATPTAPAAVQALTAACVTVDSSLKARDVTQMGWAPNPHARRSGASTPATPSSGSGMDKDIRFPITFGLRSLFKAVTT